MMARRRSIGACLSHSYSLPQDRAIVRVSLFPAHWEGSGCSSVRPPFHASAVWGRSHHARVTLTAMFKATTAAAALPPVQKKPNLFHILINPCEVLIELRATSWAPGTLGRKVAWRPEGLGSMTGKEKGLIRISCCCGYDCVPGTGDTAVSKARHSLPAGAFNLWGRTTSTKHTYRPGKTQCVCE